MYRAGECKHNGNWRGKRTGLDNEVSGFGVVDIADSWIDSGSNVTITATPYFGHQFVNWSGDVYSTDPVINVMMDAAQSVTAIFAADATPEIFIPLPEFLGEGVQFTVSSESGVLYELKYMDTLGINSVNPASWELMDGPLSGDGGDLILTDPGPLTNSRFYRLFIQYN